MVSNKRSNKLSSKLKSNTGASLALALLLFLICTVIGSVCLMAGTASSGRLSSLADSDERYYAVASAAELFHDALDGESYVVTRRVRVTSLPDDEPEPIYKLERRNENQVLVEKSDDSLTEILAIDEETGGFLVNALLDYVFGADRGETSLEINRVLENHDGVGDDDDEELCGKYLGTWSRTLTVTSDTLDVAEVTVTATMDEGGSITFVFRNDDSSGAASQVSVVSFVLEASTNEKNYTSERTETRPTQGIPEGETIQDITGETEVTITTYIHDVTVTYRAGELRKGAGA